jgi:hypothetical protein
MDVAALLIQTGILSREQVEQLGDGTSSSGRVDLAAVEQKMAREEDVLKTLADAFGMQFVDLATHEVCIELLGCFPSHDLFRHNVIPLRESGRTVIVATSDPLNLEAIDDLSSSSGLQLDAVLATSDQISGLLRKALGVL